MVQERGTPAAGRMSSALTHLHLPCLSAVSLPQSVSILFCRGVDNGGCPRRWGFRLDYQSSPLWISTSVIYGTTSRVGEEQISNDEDHRGEENRFLLDVVKRGLSSRSPPLTDNSFGSIRSRASEASNSMSRSLGLRVSNTIAGSCCARLKLPEN